MMLLILVLCTVSAAYAAGAENPGVSFPRAVGSYGEAEGTGLFNILASRIRAEPFNLVATILFLMAIVHTFISPMFLRHAHKYQELLAAALAKEGHRENVGNSEESDTVSRLRFRGEIFHLFGEVEAIFGIWVVPLLVALTIYKGWQVARDYIGHGLNFTEPLFVVVIMAIAASRPVLSLAEKMMAVAARIGGSTPASWWISILTIGPLLGSFITEPAAMTISALLLARRFYNYRPSPALSYATLGLLFVNVSVGGTLTHFAAPPVLMVAGKWHWGLSHMLLHFGWKALLGIVVANCLYFSIFLRELKSMQRREPFENPDNDRARRTRGIPVWITVVHLGFLAWTVLNNHFPALFIGGFLFYLAFTRVTEEFQSELSLRGPLLVGFFLAGLVVHGGLQGWWIAPVLGGLSELPLFFGAVVLTAFNDNAAITYLASLVPDFTSGMKHAVVAGAVVGGGLTVIANAPNPAGQSILSRFFPNGVSAFRLFVGALAPTLIMAVIFVVFRSG